ncbi:FecR family protein [Chitinophaga sp. NPDC101104]|uniref:FecR family protein n=1 Tax=Chitinophaga sp. NPDC101104 TaxID=3390561 RepID=UPI003D08396D
MDELDLQDEILKLIRKKHTPNEVLTESEQLLLDQWIAQSPEKRSAIVAKGNDLLLRIPDVRKAIRLNEYIKRTQEAAVKRILEEVTYGQPVTLFMLFRRHWHLAAASLVITMGLCAYFLFGARHERTGLVSRSENIDSINGRAVLTLQNGRTVYLKAENSDTLHEKGTVISQKGSTLAYSAEKEGERVYNELRTPAASQFTIILPDSTKVILNANSTLKFPNRFEGNIRNVKLEGEAYFIVKRNERAPFYVVYGDSKVQVLGTQFCISAYDLSNATATLKEGSIKVYYQFSEKILKPGQQGKVEKGTLRVEEADLSKELAWVDGWFFFDGEEIGPIMNSLARWYGVTVIYEGEPVVGRYAGSFKRSMSLGKILSILEENGGVHFDYDAVARKVTVKKSI